MKVSMRSLAVLFSTGLVGVPKTWADPPSFLQFLVSPHEITGEPTVLVDPNDVGAPGDPATLYVVRPFIAAEITFPPVLGTHVSKSTDGGATWTEKPTTEGGGGDSDIAIDTEGRIYVADLFDVDGNSTVPVSVSIDGADSYAYVTEADPNAGANDRQWIAARGDGIVVVTALTFPDDPVATTGTERSWRSTDAAATISAPVIVDESVSVAGPLRYDSSGTLRFAYHSCEGPCDEIRFAESTDDGATWTIGTIAGGQADSVAFAVIDTDGSGNLYAAWATTTAGLPLSSNFFIPLRSEVRFSKSSDGGNSWSPPTALSDTEKAAVFPWLVAGGAGKVNVIWFEARDDTLHLTDNVGPELGTAITRWDVKMAQSVNADAAFPQWTTVTAVKGFHTGSVCTLGSICPPPVGNVPKPFDRRNLDFFTVDADGEGNAVIAYSKDRPFPGTLTGDPVVFSDLLVSWVDVMVARQNGGTTIE